VVPAWPLRVRVALDGQEAREYEASPSAGETLSIRVPLPQPRPSR
jgi:hypothetical protein